MRKEYFNAKIHNLKSKTPNLRPLDDQISKFEKEFRDQKGSGTFTYENKFVKLVNFINTITY